MALNPTFLDSLLDAWRSHDDLRRSGADIANLAESRRRLDEARLATRSQIPL